MALQVIGRAVQLVETIPSVLIFDNSSITSSSTYQIWKQLLEEARISIDVASFYWNLRDPTAHSTSWQLRIIEIFNPVGREREQIKKA
ncbi:hypothetical protein X798_04375 [Onchocerca flexuosa]|uniref:Uncharacterized protein n=1 Tax=Onchocerca flexuosa TaxID=387005 RepID=A0A238BTG8_9BILA|nr:hypothetical protein X798_04375 [Onchocerca flexuosa]